MRYRAVIFDLWQTLAVWPAQTMQGLYARMAEVLGVDPDRFGEVWSAGWRLRSTGPLADSIHAVCGELGVEGDVDRLVAIRRETTIGALVPRDGAIETLRALRSRGCLTGLITVCSEDVAKVWDQTAFAGHFDATVFSSEVGVSKPDPRIYHAACEELSVEPGDCLYVGDGANDELPGAERVGMTAVQLRVPGEQLVSEAAAWEGTYVEALPDVLQLASAERG